jgi:hypothetical protein
MSDRQFALLLEILELAEPQISGRSLRRNLGSGGDDLVRSGMLTPVAPETPLPDPRWHDSDDLASESGWDAPLVGQAVEGAAADVGAYRISFARLLGMLTGALDVVAPRGPTELLAEHAWDLGDLWISRSRKAPILFARRLHITSTVEQLRAVLQHRAGRPAGMVLTSTASPLSVAEWPAAHQVVPLAKLLSPVGQMFGLDAQLLKNIYAGRCLDVSSVSPIHLSPDGRVLRIRESEYVFKGEVQIGIIRQLVKAVADDKRLRTKEVLEKAGSQADTPAKAFRSHPDWARLKAHIKQQRGLCWLEP